MKLKLISYPENWKEIIWTAAKTCTSEELPEDIWEAVQGDFDEKKFKGLYKYLYDSGHFSIFYHVTFVFTLSKVTRSMMSQFTRHAFFGFSVQSMRYVTLNNATFDVPEHDLMEYRFDKHKVLRQYQALLDDGYEPEDARRILPIGTHTNMTFSGNLATIIETAYNRRCILAQDEIRQLFNLIKIELTKIDPLLGRSMMIKCQKLGYCPETKNRGNKVCSIRPHVDSLGLHILNVVR